MSRFDYWFAFVLLASLLAYLYGILFTYANPAKSEPSRTQNRRISAGLFTFAYLALLVAFYLWTHH